MPAHCREPTSVLSARSAPTATPIRASARLEPNAFIARIILAAPVRARQLRANVHPAGAVSSGSERVLFRMVRCNLFIHAAPGSLPKLRVAGSSPVVRYARGGFAAGSLSRGKRPVSPVRPLPWGRARRVGRGGGSC